MTRTNDRKHGDYALWNITHILPFETRVNNRASYPSVKRGQQYYVYVVHVIENYRGAYKKMVEVILLMPLWVNGLYLYRIRWAIL